MGKAWVITVDMGYGHQRAAYPFHPIAEERIITANNDRIISDKEQLTWRRARKFYEWISRMHSVPLIGKYLFHLYDLLQHIPQYHPVRDLSRPSFQAYFIRYQIKGGLCKSIFDYIKEKDLPVITTFFITAIAAEHYGMKRILCICTDSDVNRAWVPVDSRKTRIVYCAPCREVEERLLEYGVPKENIHLTGFPLPQENIGRDKSILKHDLAARIAMLDPSHVFIRRMRGVVESYLGRKIRRPKRPLTVLFAVGGAGAQEKLMVEVIKSLKHNINEGKLRLILSVGINVELFARVNRLIESSGLYEKVTIIHSLQMKDYFSQFNQALRNTDIIWSKPSEISFYAGLGIPIIAAPPIGHHEERNLHWLWSMGLAFPQEDPRYAAEWLYSWLDDGRLAEAAFEATMKILLDGTEKISKLAKGDAWRFHQRRT